MFDRDTDLEADDMAKRGLGAPRHRCHRPRFLPCLAKAEAYTGESNDSIDDTHIQHDLKRYPSAQAQKGQVCSVFLGLMVSILIYLFNFRIHAHCCEFLIKQGFENFLRILAYSMRHAIAETLMQ